MTLIDRNGERPVCDRCHRVRVRIRSGAAVCVDCRREELARNERKRAWALAVIRAAQEPIEAGA